LPTNHTNIYCEEQGVNPLLEFPLVPILALVANTEASEQLRRILWAEVGKGFARTLFGGESVGVSKEESEKVFNRGNGKKKNECVGEWFLTRLEEG